MREGGLTPLTLTLSPELTGNGLRLRFVFLKSNPLILVVWKISKHRVEHKRGWNDVCQPLARHVSGHSGSVTHSRQ